MIPGARQHGIGVLQSSGGIQLPPRQLMDGDGVIFGLLNLRSWRVLILVLLAAVLRTGMSAEFDRERDPLAKAIRSGSLKSVQDILESKDPAVADYPPEIVTDLLGTAISAGHISILIYLKKRGWLGYCKKRKDCAPIHFAAMEGKVDAIKFFLTEGFDIGATATYYNFSALHLAALHGQLESVKFLCSQGLNNSLSDRDGQTPLEVAKHAQGTVRANPAEDARRKARLASVIAYLESGQCEKER